MSVVFPESLHSLLVPIGSVQQHPDNPRNGDIDKIIESIQVNGFLAPVVVQRSTGYILAGNHRLQALHALGETHIPVVWTDADNEQALRYLLADNATSDAAQNDLSVLTALLAQLRETEMGLGGTAITEEEHERMLLDLADEGALDGAEGFGGMAAMGIYQVVIEFKEPGDRDALAAELHERFEGQVREADL